MTTQKEKPENLSFHEKLIAARKEISPVIKDSKNPHFKNTYADINTCLDAVLPALHNHGLLLTQAISTKEGLQVLTTKISDGSESIESALALPVQPDPQKMGSVITYYRRYTLVSLLALQAEDDDGNAAANVNSSPAAAPASPKPSKPNNPNIPSGSPVNGDGVASDKQKNYIRKLLGELDLRGEMQSDFTQFVAGQRIDALSFGSARGLIDMLLKDRDRTSQFLSRFGEAIDSAEIANSHHSDSDEIPY